MIDPNKLPSANIVCPLLTQEPECTLDNLGFQAIGLRKPADLLSTDQVRVVIDTNTILDLIYWMDPYCESLQQKLVSGSWQAVTSPACILELADVLSREKFSLSPEIQQQLLSDYVNNTIIVHPKACATVQCKDSDDQKFLDLAVSIKAHFLISKDKLVLKAGRKLKPLEIWVSTPEDLEQTIQKRTAILGPLPSIKTGSMRQHT